MAPFVKLLSLITELIMRLLGLHEPRDDAPTQQEISGMLKDGTDAGVLDQAEYDIVLRALRLDAQRLSALMTPRIDLHFIDLNDDLERNLELIGSSPYSRFPVYSRDRTHVIGIVHAGDLFEQAVRSKAVAGIDIEAAAQPALFVPSTVTAIGLLEQFREHGAVQREDGSWLMDGAMPLERLRELLGTAAEFPEEAAGAYQTLAGFVMHRLGRVPAPSDHFEWNGHRFEVMDMDRHRVGRVLVSTANTPA